MNTTEILRREVDRCVRLLPETDPMDSLYTELLNSLHSLSSLAGWLGIAAPEGEAFTPDAPSPERAKEEATKPDAPSPEQPEEETVSYKKEEVRAALGKARAEKGLNVSEFLKTNYGVENFSYLPAGKYADVMARLAGMGKA